MSKPNNYKKVLELYRKFGSPKELWSVFYDCDYPVPYKKLTIYPLEVDLYVFFHLLVDCLFLPKNESGDIKAISMSYLRYLIYLGEKGNEVPLRQLRELLCLCLHEKDITFLKFGIDNNVAFFDIANERYYDDDLSQIKTIICEQNAIEIPPNLHPDLLKAYKEAEEYKRKQSKVKMCSFGDQLNVIIHNTGYNKKNLMQMSIRTFSRLLERIDKQLHYEIMTLLSPNMDKKGQESITHYLADTSADKYKNLMVDATKYKDKI